MFPVSCLWYWLRLNKPNSLRGVERMLESFAGVIDILDCLNKPNSLRGVER